MSLILEALKKSEQQRRLGEAPNLGTPIVLARRRRSLLPVLAAAIVIALGASWYLLRDKPGSTPDEAKVASTSPARTARGGATAPAATQAAATKPATQKNPAVAAAPPQVPPSRPAAAVDRKATPAVAPPVLPVPRPHDRPGSVAPPPVPAAANNALSSGPGKPHDRPAPAGPASPLDKTPASTATPEASPAAQKPVVQKPVVQKPAQPALPSIWELPYSTRKDLPAIDLTMHVYADAPADRFVVVKGERHVEGDQIADGVTIKRITADGMVLDFKGQDFTFPRDSR